MLLLLSLMLTGTLLALGSTQPLPNIIFIIADDLGWNDVSFHGSDQFQTPNIDALAYSGVILQDYYTQPICTPSRAALLTGRHPIHNGMNEDVIYAEEPWGLPLSERLLPQYLKEMGYATRAVGKWHLGFFRANYTPTHRGFDSHYGMWLGQQDYYSHYSLGADPGYDFHRGLNVSWEAKGKYNTDLFTEEAERVIQSHDVNRPLFLYLAHTAPHAPLQAPQEVIDTFSYIKDEKRRVFAAMVTKVDDSVGKVVEALKGKHMLNNSIVVFVTDNGGATNGYNGNCASNWPLRGCKDTLWEGGVRGVGLIWSPLLKATPRVHEGLFNVQDWVPTLLSATSSFNTTDTTGLDGVSQWRALNLETEAPYKEFLHNIDNVSNVGALRVDNWKIIYGRKYSGMFDGNYGFLEERVPYDLAKMRRSSAAQALELTSSALPQDQDILALRARATITCSSSEPIPCSPHIAPCLFDVTVDPCESRNLASEHPQVVEQLLSRLKEYQSTLAPSSYRPSDPRSDPKNWNLTWTNWGDFLNVSYDETSQH